MKCVFCNCMQSRVVDSRQSEDGLTIRRRRECEKCGRRFTTYERIDMIPLMVVKKDKTREPFQADKLRHGIIKACEKRPVSLEDIDALVRESGAPRLFPGRGGDHKSGHRRDGHGRSQEAR